LPGKVFQEYALVPGDGISGNGKAHFISFSHSAIFASQPAKFQIALYRDGH
jgi:hypothetical protein